VTSAVNGEAQPLVDGPGESALLQAIEVTVRFGGVTALSEVSLGFRADEICGLIGPNGAGKTTLFDTISGIRPPTSGRIVYDGFDVTRRSVTWRARQGIRRTFQRQQTFGWLSVEDNVIAAMEWRGGGGGLLADLVRAPTRRNLEQTRRRRVDEALELCGIADIAKAPTASLPLGKARLAEMARAIVDHPRVLLLDEPTSGLEEAEVESFGMSLHAVRQEEHCAVVLVEHDVGFVMRMSDRVVALDLGEILADGRPEQVRNDPAVVAAYFGA
jgi:branched-chain amino acid transport system ATP-binding protein